jgi:uncharacterized UPF0160 family protein
MKKIKLVTHSGNFHADDVFATATLILLLEKQGKKVPENLADLDQLNQADFEIIRSRDESDIESADICYDNGRGYDVDLKIFDHHQQGGAGERDNKVPYAAFGLLWKHYGLELLNLFVKDLNEKVQNSEDNSDEIIDEKITESEIQKIHQSIDESLVQPIDATDTGYEDYKSEKPDLRTLTVDDLVTYFRPTSEEGYDQSFELFLKMVEIARQILNRKIIKSISKIKDWQKIEKAYNDASDKRIIILEEGASWKEILIEKPEPLFVIFPTIDGDGFMSQAVNVELSSYKTRKSFPENWCGKAESELEKETGVEGAKFCHSAGFLCVAKTKDQIIELTQKAIEG